jgi:glycosyltransferase involved in cell wall biosynthesis
MPQFTILLPVVRPPALLPLAIESVLAQENGDFELFVVCDGAPEETVACAEAQARRDRRVRIFIFAKGERHGEAHRHRALGQATGEFVAHIADDDLWLPNHLGELARLLAAADFGNTPQVSARPDGSVALIPGDLARPELRARMRSRPFNLFGPSVAGYRLSAYRRLDEGWAPAPDGVWSDLHMWRKFLARDDFAFATRMTVSALQFPTPPRRGMTLAERAAEMAAWRSRLAEPAGRAALAEAAWRAAVHEALDAAARYDRLVSARSWRMTAPLRRLRELLTSGRG